MPKTPVSDLIVTDEDVLNVARLNIDNINDGTQYRAGVAYVHGDYFYIFRGTTSTEEYRKGLPGIYLTPDDHYIWFPVGNDPEENQKWLVSDKFATADQKSIIDVLIDHEDVDLVIPDSGKVFRPEETEEDDMLKRIIKRVLRSKDIDIDQYKSRFADKNALFNFKQVIKGDGKLSMLLFERGCNALKLKYTITVEEVDPKSPVGNPLKAPIVISSEDTFIV